MSNNIFSQMDTRAGVIFTFLSRESWAWPSSKIRSRAVANSSSHSITFRVASIKRTPDAPSSVHYKYLQFKSCIIQYMKQKQNLQTIFEMMDCIPILFNLSQEGGSHSSFMWQYPLLETDAQLHKLFALQAAIHSPLW